MQNLGISGDDAASRNDGLGLDTIHSDDHARGHGPYDDRGRDRP